MDDTLRGRDDLPPPVPPGMMPPPPSLQPALQQPGVATTVRGLVAEVAALLARAPSEPGQEDRKSVV